MSRLTRCRRSSRRLLLLAFALVLIAPLLSAGAAAAHTSTRSDGNDSPSRIDLRSVSVSHKTTSVVHMVTTYNAWTPRSLGDDSFFVIGIDKNHDPSRYERCAFIYFAAGRLRGSLSNCRSQFLQVLPVVKPSGTTAKITIPVGQTGDVYWWYGASFWVGAAPCRNVCADFTPNRLPDIFHDMVRPTVVIDAFPVLSTDFSASTTVPIGFTATDPGGSGIDTWKVQSSPPGSPPWTTEDQGTGGGSQIGYAELQEGSSYNIRVVVWDKHGNMDASATRNLVVPFDDSHAMMSYSGTWAFDTTDASYFQSTHHTGVAGDTVAFTVTGESVSIISGPGTGSVLMSIHSVDGDSQVTINLSNAAPKRTHIYQMSFGTSISRDITLEVQTSSIFVIDGIAS